jgi:hypothetical protein
MLKEITTDGVMIGTMVLVLKKKMVNLNDY